MIWKINPSTRTEDKKEKQTSSGGWRLKQEVSPHWRVRALLRGPESRSGEREGLRQTWRGCSTQREGRVQRPQGNAQGVQDKQGGRRAELSKNERSEGRDRAGGAWVTPSNKGRGRRED